MQRAWVLGVGISCAVFVGLAPNVCAAAPPESEPAKDAVAASKNAARNVRRWYGWQTLSTDGAAGALFLGAIAADHNTPLFGFSGLTFALGAPAIHVVHGNWELSIASVGVRVFAPFAGLLIGLSADEQAVADSPGQKPSSKWTLIGVGVGGLVASATDALLFAYDSRVPKPEPVRNQLLKVDPVPQLLVLRQGAGLGFSGQF